MKLMPLTFRSWPVVMPTDNVILIRIGFLSDAIVNDDDPILPLYFPNVRLDNLPQLSRTKPFLSQQSLNLVMAHRPSQQVRQACACRLTKRADQVLTVDVQ